MFSGYTSLVKVIQIFVSAPMMQDQTLFVNFPVMHNITVFGESLPKRPCGITFSV